MLAKARIHGGDIIARMLANIFLLKPAIHFGTYCPVRLSHASVVYITGAFPLASSNTGFCQYIVVGWLRKILYVVLRICLACTIMV
jgi:hypothetical protein